MRRRICQTLVGGYRTVYNETEEKSIPILLHILQVIIYLIVPGVSILMVKIFKDNRDVAIILGGLIPFSINLVI